MHDKQIKVIYFSLGGSKVKQVSLGWKKIIATGVGGFLALLIIIAVALSLFTNFYRNIKIKTLTKANGQLRTQLYSMDQKVQVLEQKIKRIEKQDDDLRVFVDLPRIDNDTRNVGVGGAEIVNPLSLNYIPDKTTDKAITISTTLDKLERRVELAIRSRIEIEQKYIQDREQFDRTPSIRPIFGGRITDRFGNRVDPFTQRIRFHEGIDISAPCGTEVYATADGIVERCQNNYTPFFGYGKEVIISHCDSIKTRYAHLSQINVKPGEKISRWDVIGLVGNTGRSTGPHLHYEVVLNSKPKNPELYMLE